MFKASFRYDRSSARLEVEGLPDSSIGQSDGVIGIISIWRLQLVGLPELEGKKEHLQSLMSVVLNYARYKASGINKSFGDLSSPVSIHNENGTNRLFLRSSKEDVSPLEISLDDAELSDLVRVLDDIRLDSRVKIIWQDTIPKPLKRKDLAFLPKRKRNTFTLLAGLVTFGISFIILNEIPLPNKPDVNPSERQISK